MLGLESVGPLQVLVPAATSEFTTQINWAETWILMFLRLTGIFALSIGVLLWFSAKKSAPRAQRGRFLATTGVVMLIAAFGYDLIVQLVYWVFTDGVSYSPA